MKESFGATYVNSTVTNVFNATWHLTTISDWLVKVLQNRSPEALHLDFLKSCWLKFLKIIMQKYSGRPNVFITSSKSHSSLSNKFYFRNQKLQTERFSRLFHKWFTSRT